MAFDADGCRVLSSQVILMGFAQSNLDTAHIPLIVVTRRYLSDNSTRKETFAIA
jgi:hypothetical protein